MSNSATGTVTFTDFELLADYFLSVMEGDDYLVDDAYALLRKYNLVDEEGFKIYGEDE